MRLTPILLRWPKKRPNGYIWNGKHQMVRKVEPWHLKSMDKDIQREKRNVHLCLNPYLTPEEERVGTANREVLRADTYQFKLRKSFIESTSWKPRYVEEGFESLQKSTKWER